MGARVIHSVRPLLTYDAYGGIRDAGWRSSVAQRAHDPEVAGSNPAPATTKRFGEVRVSDSVVVHPAAPAESGSPYGGLAEIARRLNALHPERPIPISRQLVSRWYAYREANGFPDIVSYEKRGARSFPLFDLEAVERWHRGHFGTPIETIPLFDLDSRGHPRDVEQIGHRGHPEVRESYRSSVLDL